MFYMSYNENNQPKGRTMNKIKSAGRFVYKHRTAIAVVTTATLCLAIQIRASSEWNEFLKDHDLLEEFYNFEEV